MLRDEAHSFLEAGGRIEEADMVLRMLRVAIPAGEAPIAPRRAAAGHEAEALALLQAVGGFQAFRRAPAARARRCSRVGSFLLYESAYPGSVIASLTELRDALETADPAPRSAPPVLRLGRLIADLELQQRTAGPPRAAGRDAGPRAGRARADRPRHRRAILRARGASMVHV